MNNRQGFFLISFLLYVMIVSMVCVSACHLITFLIVPSLQSARAYRDRIALHSVTDLFVRDVRSSNACSWKIIHSHELLWHDGAKDINWRYSDGKLERSDGKYHKNIWKKKTVSTLAAGLSSVLFTPDYVKGKVVGIELILTHQKTLGEPVVCYVAVR